MVEPWTGSTIDDAEKFIFAKPHDSTIKRMSQKIRLS